LAFSSNEKARRVCAAAYQEQWAIRNSFVTLRSGQDRAMPSDALVSLIEQRADEVARRWLTDVRSNPTTASCHTLDPAQLLERATVAIFQLGRWLKGDQAAGEVKAFYHVLAEERQEQGCRTQEALSSLTRLKKHLWTLA
jgi:hypothetical protein